jgi:hypothetical protein
MNPSEQKLKGESWGSIFRKSECETIWFNIITILSRTENVWRELSWEEYSKEREKDGNFVNWLEKPYFEKVLSYTLSWELCETFRGN